MRILSAHSPSSAPSNCARLWHVVGVYERQRHSTPAHSQPTMQHLARAFLKYLLLGLALASFASEAQSPQDVRIALVIGNAAYKHVPALGNSGNDAKSMAFLLGRLGFKVQEVVDGDRASMLRAIEQMRGQLKGKQAVAMLYYAGHGLQLDWRNYMVPVDAKLGKADDVPIQTVDIQEVLRAFKSAATRMNIIVLDACRDNPFPSTTSSKGLAPFDAPPGTFLAFATAPGNVAEDGDEASGNGLFTEFLIKELQRPTSIENVFKRVRLQVRQRSQGRQIPWDSSSLEEEFAFNDGVKNTFNPDDLIRDAKEKQERLRAEAEAAKQKEIELVRQREHERIRLAEEQRRREVETEERRKREIEIFKQLELERQRLAEAEKIKEQLVRQRAEAESKERERLLALAAEEQRRLAQEAERTRVKAEAEARERERQLTLYVEAEKKRAQEAAQALERAKLFEAQRLKDLEQAKSQAELEARLKRETEDKQFEIQKADWDKIKDSKNPDDFYAFLIKYPNASTSKAAEGRLAMLAESNITSSPGKNGIQATVKPTDRFQLGDVYHLVRKNPDTGAVLGRPTVRVVKMSDTNVELSNGEVYTRNGAIQTLRVDRGSYSLDPPQVYFPPEDFKVGEGWRSDSLIKYGFLSFKTVCEVKVLGRETVAVEAGVYEAYKVTARGKNSFEELEIIYWLHPDFGRPIKSVFRSSKGVYYSVEWAKHPREQL